MPKSVNVNPAPDRRDLVILGGGLVGMTRALAAAKSGFTSHVVERAEPAELTAEGVDGRASAISSASWNLFTNIGLAAALAPLGCPIASIAEVSISVDTSMPKNRASGYRRAATMRLRPVPQPISSTASPGLGRRSAIKPVRPSRNHFRVRS